MIVQEPVQAAIWHCLNHYDYSNAIFLGERLYAEVKSDETLYLLATAYYRSGNKTQAYHSLLEKYSSSSQCQLLFGICAFELDKFAEAESALLEPSTGSTRSLDEVVVDFADQASFALVLLGKIAAKTERKAQAVEAWKRALKLNPFLFSAFQLLCDIGEKPDACNVFQGDNIENISMCQGQLISNVESLIISNLSKELSKEESVDSISTPPQSMLNFNPPSLKHKKAKELFRIQDSSLTTSLFLSGFKPLFTPRHKQIRALNDESPSFGCLLDSTPGEYNGTPELLQTNHTEPYNIPKRIRSIQSDQNFSRHNKDSVLQNCKPVLSLSSNVPVTNTPTTPLGLQPSQNVRRSSRLFSSSSVKENNKSPTENKFVTPKSPSKKTRQRLSKNISSNNGSNQNSSNENLVKERCETVTSDSKADRNPLINHASPTEQSIQQAMQLQKQNIDGVMTLLRILGQAYSSLRSYDCRTAIEHLLSLSANQFDTSWVQCLMGLAYFEMNDYKSCVKYFETVHSREPHRLNFMDVYSTALWHLQKEVMLSALAKDLLDTDRNHPVSWCVNGNCFSLHKEHDAAIKFFQRAVQMDPNFYYAYTLLGHEYIATEELDKALSCFWNAVRINPRHYNAWFGMGTIYSKQERYILALMKYSKALAINPRSSVILCHVGIVQHALKQTEKALTTFGNAIVNDPTSALCKFHRGSIYFAIGRHAEALKELEELKEIVPKESSVYYLIGKVHKKLGNTDLALQHFSWASDLDPKGASNQIKEAFDPAMGRNNSDLSENPRSPNESFSLPEDSELSAVY